ncbi:type I glutamate--ammonia ligase, partial [bacterium]
VSSWKPEERMKLKNLPETLTKAAYAMREDREFLVADGIFTDEVIQYYTEALILDEQQLLGRPTPYEIEKYIGK